MNSDDAVATAAVDDENEEEEEEDDIPNMKSPLEEEEEEEDSKPMAKRTTTPYEYDVDVEDHPSARSLEEDINVLVFNCRSGKPVYARYGDDRDVATACALFQALQSSLTSSSSSEPREIRTLVAGNLRVAVWNVDSADLTLVALSTSTSTEDDESSSSSWSCDDELWWLRLTLEYAYAGMVMALTRQVLRVDTRGDLDFRLGVPFVPLDLNGPRLVGAVPVVGPLDYGLRDGASQCIVRHCRGLSKNNKILCGGLVAEGRLVTLVQPSDNRRRLSMVDLHLCLDLLWCRRTFFLQNEAWFPLCLPALHADAYVYAYASQVFDDPIPLSTNSPSPSSSLLLVLIGTDWDGFNALRDVAQMIRTDLKRLGRNGLDTTEQPPSSYQKYGSLEEHTTVDPLSSSSSSSPSKLSYRRRRRHRLPPLAAAVEDVLRCRRYHRLKYLSLVRKPMAVRHFVFRFHVPHDHSNSHSYTNDLTLDQCVTGGVDRPPYWTVYRQLLLRLRGGAVRLHTEAEELATSTKTATTTTTMKTMKTSSTPDPTVFRQPDGILPDTVALWTWLEGDTFPDQGMSYVLEEEEDSGGSDSSFTLYIGLSGRDFVFMAVLSLSSTDTDTDDLDVDVDAAAQSCAEMVRELMRDRHVLFLSKPRTWDDCFEGSR